MFKSILDFIIKRPLLSHAVLSFLDLVLFSLVITGLVIAGRALLPVLLPALVLDRNAVCLFLAACFVSLYYFAREAGQREHDLKNQGWSPVSAWLGATLMFGWGKDNVWQWVVPTLTVFGATAGLLFLRTLG
jgi:hypothetical protein